MGATLKLPTHDARGIPLARFRDQTPEQNARDPRVVALMEEASQRGDPTYFLRALARLCKKMQKNDP